MSDEFITFRDPFLSVFQSASEQFVRLRDVENALAEDRSRGTGRGLPVVPRDEFIKATNEASLVRAGQIAPTSSENFDDQERGLADTIRTSAATAKTCATIGMKYLEALIIGNLSSAQRLKGQLDGSLCDPRWARTLEEYSKYFDEDGRRKSIPYIKATNAGNVVEIGQRSRIAVLGDWATGAQPAINVMRSVAQKRPEIVIHLGDIYYSGTEQECERNFVSVIRNSFQSMQTPAVFSLSGNHDMYSGGEAYYSMIRTMNSPPLTQPASFFCLRNSDESWQLLAMDTGLHDYSPVGVANALSFLDPDEESWHVDRVREFRGKTILLSHHQLFSAFSQIGPIDPSGQTAFNSNLLGSFRKLQATGASIPAWFWGHEHNLCIYEPYGGLQRGRCLGHGAIPTFVNAAPYEPLPILTNPPKIIKGTRLAVNEAVHANGYAIIDLADKNHASVSYFQVMDGTESVVYTELIT